MKTSKGAPKLGARTVDEGFVAGDRIDMLGTSEPLRLAGIHIGLKLEVPLEPPIVVNTNRRIRAQRIRDDCKSPLWIFPVGIFVAGHEEAWEVAGCALYFDMVFGPPPPEDEIEPKVLPGNVVVRVRKALLAIIPLDCLLRRLLDLLAMFRGAESTQGVARFRTGIRSRLICRTFDYGGFQLFHAVLQKLQNLFLVGGRLYPRTTKVRVMCHPDRTMREEFGALFGRHETRGLAGYAIQPAFIRVAVGNR